MSSPAPTTGPAVLNPSSAATAPSPSSSTISGVETDGKSSPESPRSSDKTLTSESPSPIERLLTQRKKWALLAVFSLAYIIDSWNNAAMFFFMDSMSRDLSIVVQQYSWIITSYSLTFAAFLLFWGRVADIFSAKAVFAWGFLCLGVTNLIISFLVDKYSFFVFRAISGVAAAAVIPAAYRLIVLVFTPDELGKALAIFSMSAAFAFTTGSLAGGVIVLIPGSGQMAGWRWFFRILAILGLPVSIGSLYWIPSPPPSAPVTHKLKRLDLIGSLLILLAVLLLILGLTLGATYGWRTPKFLVPFLLSFAIFPSFFLWEARLPFEYSLLPPSTWRIPNFTTFIIFALFGYAFISFLNLPLIETFVIVNQDTYLIAALRLMPLGVSATAASLFLSAYPKYVTRPRPPIIIGMVACTAASILFALANGARGSDYWKFIFTGTTIGGAGIVVVNTASSVGIITAVPAEMAGVAGAVFQVALLVGQMAALSIQAGLLTIYPGNFENWANVRCQFIFVAGWGVVWLVGFLVCFRAGTKGGKDDGDGSQA